MNRNKPSRQMPLFCRDQRTHTQHLPVFPKNTHPVLRMYPAGMCRFSVIIITRFFRENKAFAKTILFESFLPVKASLFGYFPKILFFPASFCNFTDAALAFSGFAWYNAGETRESTTKFTLISQNFLQTARKICTNNRSKHISISF